MAEFLNQVINPTSEEVKSGFDAMGKPIPAFRREAAYKQAKLMGLDTEKAHAAISGIAGCLERDEPYNAMAAGMKYIDLTGTYRLMSYLLVGASHD